MPATLALYWKNIKMFELQKADCSDSIGHGVTLTRNWRKKINVRYPDSRNVRATEWLGTIATEVAGLSDTDYLHLQPYLESDGASWQAAISKAARGVGFQRRIRNFPSFIEYLMEVLKEPVTAQ